MPDTGSDKLYKLYPKDKVSLKRRQMSRTINVSHLKNYLHSLCIRNAHLDLNVENHLVGGEFIFLILEMYRLHLEPMHLVNVII